MIPSAAGLRVYWDNKRSFVPQKKVKHMSISSLTSTKYLIFVLMVCRGSKVKWKTPFIFTLVSVMLYQKRR